MELNTAGKHIKIGIDKRGRKTRKWVNNEALESTKKLTTKKNAVLKEAKPQEWWQSKLKHLNLSRYPVGVPESDVNILVDLNDQHQCNSRCVAKYKDPKTGVMIMLYTKEFLEKNAAKKWERMKNIKSDTIQNIREKSLAGLSDPIDKIRQASAICLIIANTGLRVGQTTGLEKTGNKGVSTLNPDDVTIAKDGTIKFDFIGKSYKHNTAEISGEPELAKYLKALKKSKAGKTRLFDIDRTFTDAVFKNKFGFKDLKIKDMRTYVATDLATKSLMSDVEEVKASLKGDKSDIKILNNRLKEVYKEVSEKLNNTPKMAETAYIHPAVKIEWIKRLGLSPELLKSLGEDGKNDLDYILDNSEYNETLPDDNDINEEDEEECDEYPLFDFEREEQEIASEHDEEIGDAPEMIQKSVYSDDLEKSKYKKFVPVHRKSGIKQELRIVGSDKDATKSKHFNLNSIGEHYDKHLTDLVDIGDGMYRKISSNIGVKFGTTKNMDRPQKYTGLSIYHLHPDEVSYREHLLKQQQEKMGLDDEKFNKFREIYAKKHNKYIGLDSDYDVVRPEDLETHNQFLSNTKSLHERDENLNKENAELHKKEKTEKGEKLLSEEAAKKKAEQEETTRKQNEKFFDNEEAKYRKFFETIGEYDIDSMNFVDFYKFFVTKNNMRKNMKDNQPHPINKHTDVKIHLNDGTTREGKLGDLVNWAKTKHDNNSKETLPFNKIEILNYMENPYRSTSGFSSME